MPYEEWRASFTVKPEKVTAELEIELEKTLHEIYDVLVSRTPEARDWYNFLYVEPNKEKL